MKILKPTEFCTLYEGIAWYVNYISIRILFLKKRKKKDLLWALIPLHPLPHSLFSLQPKLFESVAFTYHLYFLTFPHHVSSSSLLLLWLLLQNRCYSFGARGARSWVILLLRLWVSSSLQTRPLCALFCSLPFVTDLNSPFPLHHMHTQICFAWVSEFALFLKTILLCSIKKQYCTILT